jgi:hypothetical protein
MNCLQPSFDVLVIHSLSKTASSHLVQDSFCQTKQATPSIDDLLADYKHTQTSICEFIACLDSDSCTSMSVSHNTSILGAEFRKSDNVRELESSNSKAPCLIVKSLDEQHTPEKKAPCRCKRRRMSIQEKEDRRRDQNREAQRRFREKNRLCSAPSTSQWTTTWDRNI